MYKEKTFKEYVNFIFADNTPFDFLILYSELPRKHKRTFLEHIAKECGCKFYTVKEWVTKKHVPPKHNIKIANALGFRASELYPELAGLEI